ncbi:hypothetical protein [Bdellovibrio bacteriovorus]|uniref:hypothetical protein n=1 Tax=Bdellovibrio TaxID=958 RepID=UPI0035A97AA7
MELLHLRFKKNVPGFLILAALTYLEVVNAQQVIVPVATKSPEEIAEQKAQRLENKCKELRQEIKDANNKMTESCSKAGLSVNCKEKALDCSQTLQEESYPTIDALATVMGIPATTDVSSACPQMSGGDYYKEIERLEKEVKETQKDIAELAEEEAKIKENFSTSMQNISQAMTDAQQEFSEAKEKIADEERQQISAFQSKQIEDKKELNRLSGRLVQLRGKMTESLRKKSASLLELTSPKAGSQFDCRAEYRNAAQGFGAVNSAASGNHITMAKAKKAAAIKAFQVCLGRIQQARAALIEQNQNEIDTLTKEIESTQSDMDAVNDSLSLASNQLDEIKASNENKRNSAQKKVVDLLNLSQQKMVAAQDQMQTKLKGLATKQQSYSQALNRAQNALLRLKQTPAPGRSAEVTPSSIVTDLNNQTEIIAQARDQIKNDPELQKVCHIPEERSAKRSTSSTTRGRQ